MVNTLKFIKFNNLIKIIRDQGKIFLTPSREKAGTVGQASGTASKAIARGTYILKQERNCKLVDERSHEQTASPYCVHIN